MTHLNLTQAVRRVKAKGRVATINILNLALGMTAFIFLMLWVLNEKSFDKYHKDYQQIFSLITYFDGDDKNGTSKSEFTPYPLGDAITLNVSSVTQVARISPVRFQLPLINVANKLFREKNCAYVDEGWFTMFSYDFLRGSITEFSNHVDAIVITEEIARKFFGNKDPIGQECKIDTAVFIVKGVVADNKPNSSFTYDIFIPLKSKQTDKKTFERQNHWGVFSYLTFIKVTPSTNPIDLAQNIYKFYPDKVKRGKTLELLSLSKIHLDEGYKSQALIHGNKKLVSSLLFVAIFILIIACINYINISTAQVSTRIKEFTIKKILGANKSIILKEFFLETTIIASLALVVSIILLYTLFPSFRKITGTSLNLPIYSLHLWTILFSTFLLTLVLTGIYPSIIFSKYKIAASLKNTIPTKISGNVSSRKILVAFQFFVSACVIMGTIVMFSQLRFIHRQHSSFNKSQIFLCSPSPKWFRDFSDSTRALQLTSLKTELKNSVNIEDCTVSDQNILNVLTTSVGSFEWDGKDPNYLPIISQVSVDESFDDVFGIKMKDGRWFEEGRDFSTNDVILNETAITSLGIPSPVLGKRIKFMGKEATVVGITKDFRYKSLREKEYPLVFFKNSAAPYIFIKAVGGKSKEALKDANRTWAAFFPYDKFGYTFLDETFNSMYETDIKASNLMILFAVVSLLISCLGLFSLVSFILERQIKEISIRKILGASSREILTKIAFNFVRLALVAAILANPITWLISQKWLDDFQYKFQIKWWVFAIGNSIILAMVLVLVVVSTLKTAKSNPVKNLRESS